jgi:hypothetical protein
MFWREATMNENRARRRAIRNLIAVWLEARVGVRCRVTALEFSVFKLTSVGAAALILAALSGIAAAQTIY